MKDIDRESAVAVEATIRAISKGLKRGRPLLLVTGKFLAYRLGAFRLVYRLRAQAMEVVCFYECADIYSVL